MPQVEVVYCAQPGQVDTSTLTLPAGATLAEAVQASGLLQRHGLALDGLKAGIWSRLQPLDTVLRDGDRAEIYRPLTVDPKEARRLRYKRHRSETRGRAASDSPKR